VMCKCNISYYINYGNMTRTVGPRNTSLIKVI